jgi:hypothetical protein
VITGNRSAVIAEIPGIVTSPLIARDSEDKGFHPVEVNGSYDAIIGIWI